MLAEAAPTRLSWTREPDDLDRVIHALDGRVFVVAGGDGSLHLAVNHLHGSGLLGSEVGVVPLGTGNDLARGVGLPLDPAAAAARIVDGAVTPLPLARITTGEIVVNNAHVGLGVDASQRATPLKRWCGRFAYPLAAVATAVGHGPHDVEIDVDGDTVVSGPVDAVFVALGSSIGGGAVDLAQADGAAPKLTVAVVGSTGLADRLGLAVADLRGELSASDRFEPFTGTEVAITSAGAAIVDGEVRTWPDRVGISLLEERWSLRL